jgi:hypothetical protein
MEPNQNQILNYLKGKYINTTAKSPKTNDSDEKGVDTTIGEESDLSGAEAENKFLISKLDNIQTELTKWLSILKSKL